MSEVKVITLSQYNKDYGSDPAAPLYVVNTSDGRLTMNILNDQNNADSVIIPLTHAPVDITAIAPRVNCMSNTMFKRYINRRFLAVVDNKSVEEALASDPELREEFESVNNGGEAVDFETLNLSQQGKDNKKTAIPDNVQKSTNPKLDSIIMDCQIAESMTDKSERSSKIKEIEKVFRRSSNQFNSSELKVFIEQCPTQEIKDLAINKLENISEA